MTEEEKKKEMPNFEARWFWAFAALMLYKLGGKETITVELLEKFNIDNCPEVIYDHDLKAFIMRLKKEHRPLEVIVPNKVRRKLIKTPKLMRN